MIDVRYTLAAMLIASLLWIGFVGAISFMEAWIKFRAPSVTVTIGLEIGRLVFNALNKVEWALAAIIVIALLIEGGFPRMSQWFWWAIPMTVLIIQTFWLLPGLDQRAVAQIQGEALPPSNLHWYYVAGECIKTVSLLLFSLSFFNWSYSSAMS